MADLPSRANSADTPAPKRKGKPMREGDLLALIYQLEKASLGSEVASGATISMTVGPTNAAMPTLEIDRYNALNAYLARPLGNEVENRSQVVLPEVRDTIEWIKPELMRMFAGAKTICRFDPENQGDEKQAELETLVVNHIFMQQNNGLLMLHDFFTDALLLRNGYGEVYGEEYTDIAEERYRGISEFQVAAVLKDNADEELEVLEQREYLRDVPITQAGPQGPVPSFAPVPVFDLKLRRRTKKRRVCVTCLPPEEMRISPRTRGNLEKCEFAEHITTATRSDLLTQGYDRDFVESISAARPNWLEIDALARNQVVDQLSIESPSDFSTQEVELRKIVMRVDFDGDGIAELRRVVIGGDKIGSNEVIEETPFVSCVAKRMPHRHTGMSIYDEVMDLQVMKTMFLRAGFDNLTIANNLRYAVDWRNCNIDDLLTSRPHGPIRGNGPPPNWIMPIQPPSNLVGEVLPAVQYLDDLRASRTGIGRNLSAMDPDELQNVTKGAVLAQFSAAALKVEMVARLLAEGVKDIFRKIHAEIIRNEDKPLWFELSGQWVEVDPTSWRRRTKVSPNVGLGSGNREELRSSIQLLAQAQQQLGQMGLVGPKQAYESFKVFCEALGFANPERFAMDPSSEAFAEHQAQMKAMAQAQPPAPPVQVAQIKANATMAQEQAETQRAVLNAQKELASAAHDRVADAVSSAAQMRHEAAQTDAQMAHEVIQGHSDRLIQQGAQQNDITLALIKAFSSVLAAQDKGDPAQNAGEQIAADVQTAEAGLEGRPDVLTEHVLPMLQGLQEKLQALGAPRTATLPDGRQIRIEGHPALGGATATLSDGRTIRVE